MAARPGKVRSMNRLAELGEQMATLHGKRVRSQGCTCFSIELCLEKLHCSRQVLLTNLLLEPHICAIGAAVRGDGCLPPRATPGWMGAFQASRDDVALGQLQLCGLLQDAVYSWIGCSECGAASGTLGLPLVLDSFAPARTGPGRDSRTPLSNHERGRRAVLRAWSQGPDRRRHA